MADSQTANYDFVKPEVGASGNTWGGKNNANWDAVDSLIASIDVNTATAKAVLVLADKLAILDSEDSLELKVATITALKTLLLASVSLIDNTFELKDNTDATKKLAFELSGIATGQTRTLTVPDLSGTIALIAGAQTLQDKTLIQPILTLKNGTSEAPTAEADIRWDSDDNYLRIGDGAASKDFIPMPAGIAESDLLLVNAGSKSYKRLAKGTARQYPRMKSDASELEYIGGGFELIETGNLSGKGSDLIVAVPSGVTEFLFVYYNASLNGGWSDFRFRLGDSGGIETSGYGGFYQVPTTAGGYNSTFIELSAGGNAGDAYNGRIHGRRIAANGWDMDGHFYGTTGSNAGYLFAFKSLSDELSQIQMFNDGADTFDAGSYALYVRYN